MAKVSGPLMSLDARGKFANALVFTNWKGRPVVRQLVTPSNPQSADQMTARNFVRAFGVIQHFASMTALKGDGRATLDRDLMISASPAGQAWNGTLVKAGIGAGQVNALAAATLWGTNTHKAAWTTAAAALTPPITDVVQKSAGGVAATALDAGEVFFLYQYALYILGVRATVPDAVAVYA